MSPTHRLILPVRVLAVLLSAALVAGCAAAGAVGAVAGLANSALEMTGMKKPATGPIKVDLGLEAGNNLNANGGQALALVTKIYYLQDVEGFMRAPMATLLDASGAAPGAGILAVRDITLTPGQRYRNVEQVPREAVAIGVAGMFFNPAPGRWKQAFLLEDVERSGIAIAMHACAMTVVQGQVVKLPGAPDYDPARLSGVVCPR